MAGLLKTAAGIVVIAALAAAMFSSPHVASPPPSYATPPYMQAVLARIAADEARLGPNAPKAAVSAGGIVLRSVGFTFPTEARAFPPGQGVEAMLSNCTACHTPGMILDQPPLTRSEWSTEVTKMINAYKAPVETADIPTIVAYLASISTREASDE